MIVSLAVNSRAFRYASLFVAASTGYMQSAIGINSIFGSVGDALRNIARMPQGHYTTAPGMPYLGKNPARDPHGRGGWWKTKSAKPALSGGHHTVALSFQGMGHVLSVAAEPGPAMPWEGSASTAGGSVNTGNGNVLTSLHLVGWKSRGMNIDFTLYHNSQTNYSDELANGWTWTYDIYINNLTGNPVVHWGDGLSIPYTAPGGGGGGDHFEATHGPRASAEFSTTYTPPAGVYDGLVQNSDTTWTLTKKNGTKYQFNTAGFCTSIVDLNGNTITLTLNSSNYCTKVTDPTGKYLTINLSSSKFTSIVDPLSRTWSFTQSGGELTTVAWPSLGGTVYNDTFTYNSGNAILTHTDKRGEVWTKSYNSDQSIASETDPLSHSSSYGYTSSVTTITDPLSHVRTDNYSSGALSSSQDESSYSDSFTSRDSNFNVLTHVDKNSKTWTYTWDSMGNMLTETDPLSHEWVWTFNSLNEPLTETDPLSHETQYSYDSYGSLLTVVDPLSHTVKTNTYGSYGLLATASDALSNSVSFAYDSYGNCSSITDPLSNVTSIGVDSLNRTVSVTDPLSHVEQTAYDAWGRVVTITHADSTTVTKTWDLQNNLSTVTDENSKTQNFYCDAAGRLTSTVNARSDTESYGYDNANRRTSVCDGNSHTRNYTFTNRGEVATLTLADSSEEQWAYDGNGATTAYTNPLSQTIYYVMDNAGRETTVDYPTGTDTSFTFDNANRRTQIVDASGTTSWGFDNASRLTSLNTPQGNMTYTFDNAGKRATMVEGVGTTSYYYDADSRLTSLSNPYSETTSLSYDAASRLTQKTFASGAYDSMGYDSRDRMTSLYHKNSSGTTLSSESYSYDYASNMTSKTVDSLTTSYTVDAINQLLTESNTGYSSTLTYDANGNRASQVLNGTTYSYNYNSGDELTSITSGGSTVKSYTYDGAGRTHTVMTNAGTTTLNYDYEDRISGITYPSSATNSFTYNGLDTRVGKVDSAGTNTYKHDGANVTSPILSDGSIAYTPGFSERKSGVTTFDHANYLGTFSRQTNSSQTTTATRVYDAFGSLESSTGSPQSPFGYVGGRGYQEDLDSGLKLLGHRYYDPSTGRFLVRDSAKVGRNWYEYSLNNPTGGVDPDGLGWKRIAATVGGAIIGGILTGGNPVGIQVGAWLGDMLGDTAEQADETGRIDWGEVITGVDENHTIPRAIQNKLTADQLPDGAGERTFPVPPPFHTGSGGLHSGPSTPVRGGNYNNWWNDRIETDGGGYSNVTKAQIAKWADEMEGNFGWPPIEEE